ncbi:hypothetical protein Q9R19_03295 [Microbacterium sp. ARD32]|uniref:hypothetical protein n=1 Tax=Microbacterium sp. ARD32 TaxID=2962577 RepID=UPI0028825F67|nr:hypothetical protein [Microbacterium sp. ARD32]MDT0156645.1 hypothetical protein [Microbacterium sp. ARD32]
MTSVRTHRYAVDAGDVDTMLERRGNLLDGIRSANPAFAGATLIRLDDGSYLDIWSWNSAEDMQRASQAAAEVPLVGATMSLTSDHTSIDGEVLDQR